MSWWNWKVHFWRLFKNWQSSACCEKGSQHTSWIVFSSHHYIPFLSFIQWPSVSLFIACFLCHLSVYKWQIWDRRTHMFDSCPINYAEEQVKDNCSGLLKKQIRGWGKEFPLESLLVLLAPATASWISYQIKLFNCIHLVKCQHGFGDHSRVTQKLELSKILGSAKRAKRKHLFFGIPMIKPVRGQHQLWCWEDDSRRLAQLELVWFCIVFF